MRVGAPVAETYLRRAFERVLLGFEGDQGPFFGGAVMLAARALVAAGAIELTEVRDLVEEYRIAAHLRGMHVGPPVVPRPAPSRRRLTPARVCLPERTYAGAGGPTTLERLVLAEDSVALHLSGTVSDPTRGRLRRGMVPHAPGPGTSVPVTDERGTTVQAQQGGSSWGGAGWEARYRSDAPLALDTAWIELEGERVELPVAAEVPAVTVEARHIADPLQEMLLGAALDGMGPPRGPVDLEAPARALVACGVLDAGDPLLVAVQAATTLASVQGASPAAVASVPAPWGSVLARLQASGGKEGRVPLGAVAEVGGSSVRLELLVAHREGFELHVTSSPGAAILGRGPFSRIALGAPPLTWWAEDDRENTYYGLPSSWGGSDELGTGQIDFFPAIDPAASELRLLVTASSERAVLPVPLERLGGR